MERHTIRISPILAIALGLFTFGCGDDSGGDGDDQSTDAGARADADQDEFEIAGDWSSDFGDESISAEMWGAAIVVSFHNDDNVAITRNADDAEWSPGLYNRIVWTDPDADAFYYCTVDYDLESAADAEASDQRADDSDPDNAGCGGFAWTRLEAL